MLDLQETNYLFIPYFFSFSCSLNIFRKNSCPLLNNKEVFESGYVSTVFHLIGPIVTDADREIVRI